MKGRRNFICLFIVLLSCQDQSQKIGPEALPHIPIDLANNYVGSLFHFAETVDFVELDRNHYLGGQQLKTTVDITGIYVLSENGLGNKNLAVFDPSGNLNYKLDASSDSRIGLSYVTDFNLSPPFLYLLGGASQKIDELDAATGHYKSSIHLQTRFDFLLKTGGDEFLLSRNYSSDDPYNIVAFDPKGGPTVKLLLGPKIRTGIAVKKNRIFNENLSIEKVLIHQQTEDVVYTLNGASTIPFFEFDRGIGALTEDERRIYSEMPLAQRALALLNEVNNHPDKMYPIDFMGILEGDIVFFCFFYKNQYFWHFFSLNTGRSKAVQIEQNDMNSILGPYPVAVKGSQIYFLTAGEYLNEVKLNLTSESALTIENLVVRQAVTDLLKEVDQYSNSFLIGLTLDFNRLFNL